MADVASELHRLRIAAIFEETAEAKSFTLEPLDGWDPDYVAGQFITLVFFTSHGEKRRSYSISSVKALQEPLRITVKRLANGEFSRTLTDRAKVGDVLFSTGTGGFFTLQTAPEAASYAFLAAGSGITPCFALLKTILFTSEKPVLLIYSNSSSDTAIFLSELHLLAQRFAGRFVMHLLFSDAGDLEHRRLGKWLLERLLDRYLSNRVTVTEFFMCGPFDYMQMAEIALRNRVARTQIHKENYSHTPRQTWPHPPDEDTHQITIHNGGKTITVGVTYPEPITRAAKKQGLSLPYSCEAGRCGSCVATVVRGKIWMAYNEVLTDREVAKGRVLTCQGFAIEGDAEITFDTTTASKQNLNQLNF